SAVAWAGRGAAGLGAGRPGRDAHIAAWDGRAGICRAVGRALDRRGSASLGATPAGPARGPALPPHSAPKLEPETGDTGRLTTPMRAAPTAVCTLLLSCTNC